jgi:hypothetical protein
MTNGNGGRNGGPVVRTAITTIGDNLKGSPLTFGLVVINTIFVVVVLFLLWHVSSAVERRDKLIGDCIENSRKN